MDNVKTTQKQVFDFQAAVQAGTAMDKQGRVHRIVANGESHLITRCDDVEFCFDQAGRDLATFPSTRLTTPFAIKTSLFGYVCYNKKTMTVLSMHQGYMSAWKSVESDDENIEVINVTHPLNKPVLKALGLDGYPKIESVPGQ